MILAHPFRHHPKTPILYGRKCLQCHEHANILKSELGKYPSMGPSPWIQSETAKNQASTWDGDRTTDLYHPPLGGNYRAALHPNALLSRREHTYQERCDLGNTLSHRPAPRYQLSKSGFDHIRS